MLNGSPKQFGCTYTALSEAAGALNADGVETDIHHIGAGPIQGCTACGQCRKSGYCAYGDDSVNKCIDSLKGADGFIVGSPVYYAGPTGSICAFLDRLFYMKSAPYAYKPAASVVSCRRAGSTAALDRLNKYYYLAHMPIVTSQYWNMVHGNTPDEVRRDLEGLQIMRTLGHNMAWLLKCIAAGRGSVPFPPQEARVGTNFIR